MTPKKLVLFFLLLVGCSNADTYAGHVIRKTHIVDKANITGSAATLESITRVTELARPQRADRHEEKGKKHAKDTSGWEGIVSLSCGVLGIFTFGLASIPAIIFGALGLGRGKKNQGLALAGLILGIVTIFLFAMLVVLIASI